MLEPPRASAQAHYIPCFPGNDVDRGGSIQSNHPELMRQNSTHLAISVIMWVEEVRYWVEKYS